MTDNFEEDPDCPEDKCKTCVHRIGDGEACRHCKHNTWKKRFRKPIYT